MDWRVAYHQARILKGKKIMVVKHYEVQWIKKYNLNFKKYIEISKLTLCGLDPFHYTASNLFPIIVGFAREFDCIYRYSYVPSRRLRLRIRMLLSCVDADRLHRHLNLYHLLFWLLTTYFWPTKSKNDSWFNLVALSLRLQNYLWNVPYNLLGLKICSIHWEKMPPSSRTYLITSLYGKVIYPHQLMIPQIH